MCRLRYACVRGAMCPRRAWTGRVVRSPPWLARPPPCTLTTMSGASARPVTRPPCRQRPPPATPLVRRGGPWWTASAARSTRSRTRRRPEDRRLPHRLPRRRPPPAPPPPPWAPTRRSLSTSRPSATTPSPASSGTLSNPGDTPQMLLLPSTTSTPLVRRPTTTFRLRGSANRHFPSGQRALGSTSLTLMEAATKGFRSPVGTTLTERRVETSPCLTSEETNGGRRSPRHQGSHTTHTGSVTTRLSPFPEHLIRLLAPYPVSIT